VEVKKLIETRLEVWEKREIPWEFNNNKKFIDFIALI
jgi:hypothetical protein